MVGWGGAPSRLPIGGIIRRLTGSRIADPDSHTRTCGTKYLSGDGDSTLDSRSSIAAGIRTPSIRIMVGIS